MGIDDQRSAEARLRAFSALGHRLCSARTQADAIRIILDIADNFFGWDACTFDSYSPEDDHVTGVIVVDRIEGVRRDIEPKVKHQRPTQRQQQVIERGPLLILREPAAEMPADAVPMGDISRPSASLMYVPITSCDRLIGFLSIQSYTPNAYTREDLDLLKALADHGAGALDRIQAEEKIKGLNAELEERIAQRTAALRETVGELEAFSYSVSHDMRAPLRAMHGFANLLAEEYSGKTLDAEGQDYLQRISRSAARLDALIEDVLHYTRVLRGGFKMAPVDVAQLARDLLDAHPEWKSAGAEIQIVEPIPQVLASEALLAQCLTNLLSNAVKFVADGTTPRVKVHGVRRDDSVRIWIEDNGVGIPKEYQSRVFRMFERLQPASEFEGTGIGLTIVRKAAQRMEGSVGFESEDGHGSRFWVELRAA